MPSLFPFFDRLRQEFSAHRRTRVLRLLKAALMVSVAPAIVFYIFVLYHQLSLSQALTGTLAVFSFSLLFTWPYLADLSALTDYVTRLARDKKVKAPSLSFLSNVEELSGAVENLHGVWEKKKLDLEVLLAESRILFDTLPDILIMLDRDLRVVRANSAAHITFRKNLRARRLNDFLNLPELIEAVHNVMVHETTKDLEITVPEPVSRQYVVRVERFPVFSAGGIATILVMHDVTEARRSEQMMADFVANASHEIRTPLTSLIGFIETLQTTAKDDPEAQQQFLEIMAEQGNRMALLVQDLLSLSKIEMNKYTLPSEQVNIPALLRESMQLVDLQLHARDMEITVNIEKNLPSVTGDASELLLVFNNLLTNAIKYGHEGSTIEVTLALVRQMPEGIPTLKDLSQAIAIAVKDRSDGIEKQHLSRLTERFYRVDTARTRKMGGTGLGLAIVKQILTRHHGALTVESELKQGSVFTVYLPAGEEFR